MRYLIAFMLLAGFFVLGNRTCTCFPFGGIQGKGEPETESRNVSGFHSIEFETSGRVIFTTGDYQVTVEAQKNLLPHLKTENENGVLRIYSDENISPSRDMIFRVSAPAIKALSLSGSGSITSQSLLESDEMRLSLGGSGEISVPQGSFNTVACDLGGSGAINLGGKANSVNVNLDGSGNIDAKSMEINELKAGISGSGSVSAHVIQALKADISGSGEVIYSGSPSVESNISGSGEVKKLPNS